MKFLFDLIPVFVFFVAYFAAERSPEGATAMTSSLLGALGLGSDLPTEQGPIMLATFCAIVATFGQVGWLMLRRKTIDKMLWLSLGIIVVMGGATLAFRDDTFIKWKPTVLYWAFGATLLVSERIFKRNLMRSMTQGQFEMPDRLWVLLNLSWVGFFVFMGALNLYVAFNFSKDTWVTFKLFGGMGLMLVFALAQGFFLSKHIEHHEGK